ncbi:hypothetical protein [Streptomyces sp. NPDC097619]|uniref:hypothetical protein n=1 Tax=Streptomyces sp. NPDC097619 TaxID=3157228 RepID=UPI00332D3CB1
MTRTTPPGHRFRDPRAEKDDFLDSILVRCPRCDRPARVISTPTLTPTPAPAPDPVPAPKAKASASPVPAPPRAPSGLFAPRRLACGNCGLAKSWTGRSVVIYGSSRHQAGDPYFGLPLWLQTETRHGLIWAYDLAHLDLIKRYVQATLREGIPWGDHGRRMTLIARLPFWMKKAGNRAEILRAIDRIHATLGP